MSTITIEGGGMSDLFSHLFGGGADSDDEMGGFPGFFMGGGGRRRSEFKNVFTILFDYYSNFTIL